MFFLINFEPDFNRMSKYNNQHTNTCIAVGTKQPPGGVLQKGVLKKFAKFTGKHLCCGLSLNKVRAEPCNFIKKETPTQVLSCKLCQIFKSIFL